MAVVVLLYIILNVNYSKNIERQNPIQKKVIIICVHGYNMTGLEIIKESVISKTIKLSHQKDY